MCGVVLGDDEEAGGVFVDAVDDAGAGDAADAGKGVAAMGEEGVYQRHVGVAGGGVDGEAGGFVDDEEVVVFVDDIEGDSLRFDVGGHYFGDGEGEFLARFYLGIGVFERHALVRERALGY